MEPEETTLERSTETAAEGATQDTLDTSAEFAELGLSLFERAGVFVTSLFRPWNAY
jgi:hypothetical protein